MWKFDTRKKKPKLWNLLIQLFFVGGVLLFMILDDAHRHTLAISLLLDVYILAVIVQIMAAFFGQLRYNPYSYNTIYYMGFSLFFLAVLIMMVTVTVRQIQDPVHFQVHEILHVLLNSAKTYMLISFPFILAFSVALCVSNVSLIRHEGRRLVNVLGIILSFMLVAGEVFLYLFDYYVSGSRQEVMIHELIGNLFAACYLYFECMLIGAIVADSIAASFEPDKDKDFLIILGCGFRKDGTPSPLLRGRIDRALAFARIQKAETGKDLIFVTSGGQGPDEPCSESACMKRYLLQQGVSEAQIIEEDRSTDTRENMRFSKEKIWQVNPEGKIAFSTTNYHVFRSGLYARRVKMKAQGMGAKTKWYFWPNAAVREFVGLLTDHRLKQALIFTSLTVSYILLTLWAYSL